MVGLPVDTVNYQYRAIDTVVGLLHGSDLCTWLICTTVSATVSAETLTNHKTAAPVSMGEGVTTEGAHYQLSLSASLLSIRMPLLRDVENR